MVCSNYATNISTAHPQQDSQRHTMMKRLLRVHKAVKDKKIPTSLSEMKNRHRIQLLRQSVKASFLSIELKRCAVHIYCKHIFCSNMVSDEKAQLKISQAFPFIHPPLPKQNYPSNCFWQKFPFSLWSVLCCNKIMLHA